MGRSYIQNINKEISALNDMLNQMHLTDTYRTFHPKATECTFFSSAREAFLKMDYMLRHKTSLELIFLYGVKEWSNFLLWEQSFIKYQLPLNSRDILPILCLH